MKKTRLFLHGFSLFFLLVIVGEMGWLHSLRTLDFRLSDAMVKQHAKGLTPDPDIVIISIDDGSLASMQDEAGKWPWPRAVHGELVEGIAKQMPKAIVFDFDFIEKDLFRPESDDLFNQALKGKNNVFFPLIRQPPTLDAQAEKLAIVAPKLGLQKTERAQDGARAAFLLPLALDESAWRLGTINFNNDPDGVGRGFDLYTDVYGWRAPSLAAKLGDELGYTVPKKTDIALAWRGEKRPFHRIPYADLYQDFSRQKPLRDQQELRGKIVIIGTDASALHDLRVTPIDSLYSGLDILATAIDNVKNQRWMRQPPPEFYFLFCLLLVGGIYLCFFKAVNALLTGLAMLGLSLIALMTMYVSLAQLWLLHLLTPLALAWIYYFSLALRAYVIERQARQKTVQLFSRFVNPHVVKELVNNEGIIAAGESRAITVLFSDIRGFTSLSENRTPQELVILLNRYFSLQVAVVFKHNGVVDKFIGDCIMAFWGAPLDNPEHALNAVEAALEMTEVLKAFKLELGADVDGRYADFDVGIGLHSGPAVVGLIGSEQRKEYTAIGDTVNLASRIEGLTKDRSRILVSHETMLLCGDKIAFKPMGCYKVKGREQEVELYAPLNLQQGDAT